MSRSWWLGVLLSLLCGCVSGGRLILVGAVRGESRVLDVWKIVVAWDLLMGRQEIWVLWGRVLWIELLCVKRGSRFLRRGCLRPVGLLLLRSCRLLLHVRPTILYQLVIQHSQEEEN